MSRKFEAKREQGFSTNQHVNEVLLPSYNALHDPFLKGYFHNPAIKKHLKEVGVLKTRKRSRTNRHALVDLNQKPTTSKKRRSKSRGAGSLGRKTYNATEEMRLPAIFDEFDEDRRKLQTGQGNRARKIYKSVDKPEDGSKSGQL